METFISFWNIEFYDEETKYPDYPKVCVAIAMKTVTKKKVYLNINRYKTHILLCEELLLCIWLKY